jgi:hypothetical protein
MSWSEAPIASQWPFHYEYCDILDMDAAHTSRGKRGGTDEPRQEPQDGETGKIGDQRGRHLQNTEDRESDDVRRGPANRRDLSDGSEEQWADAVAGGS